MGDVVGKQLIIAGFDNRIRLYNIHHENGVQKAHVFVGHTMNIYNMIVLDDGIFTTSSYDGTIRWWNTQMKTCFSYFNVIYLFIFSFRNFSLLIKYYMLICQNSLFKNKSLENLIDKDVL